MIHSLKTEAQYFQDVIDGKKPFEVRQNDRDFMVGDFLALNELTPHTCNDKGERLCTGRCCLVEITYVLTDERFAKSGFAVLGIRPCNIYKTSEQVRHEYFGGERVYKVPEYDPLNRPQPPEDKEKEGL